MSEWHRPCIGNLVESHWSGEWGTDPDGGPDVARVYRSTEIDDHGHLRKGQGVPRTIPRFRDGKALKHGDILVEASGGAPNRPVGRVALAEFEDGRHFTSNFVRTLRPTQSVDGNWLRWKLHWLNNQSVIWRHQQQTTGIINLKIESYLNQEIAAPKDQKEQERIASIIDLVDTQIEATEALIAKQERLRAGLMQDLFTRGVDENGELRPPREEAPHLYHETELGWLPKGWEPAPLARLIDPTRPISYGILMPGPHVPDGIPVIKVKDIRGGRILEMGLRRTSKLIDAEYARSRLRKGDILFTIRGTVGRIAPVPESLAGANITQDTARLAVTGCDPSFARYFLESETATRYVAANTLGNAVQGINLGELKKLLVPNFDPSEQRELVNCILRHDAFNDELNSELSCLKLLKSGLMQDLLTGTVSVEPLLEKEPA